MSKLTAVSIMIGSRRYYGFIELENGKTITYSQLFKVFPQLCNERRGSAFSVG